MSLSFEESLKNSVADVAMKNVTTTADMIPDNASIAAPAIMSQDEVYGIAAYSGED